MAQSSIEWLVNQLKISTYWNTLIAELEFMDLEIDDIIEQAKEMHKQESIAAQMDMFHFLNNLPVGMQYLNKRENAEKIAEIYYNETFKNK